MMFKIISSNSSDNELRAYSKTEIKEAKTKGREKERVITVTVNQILESLNKHQEGSLNSRLQHVITGILIEEKETRSLDITPYNDFEYDYITSHSLKELPYPNYIISACIFWRNINLNDSVDHLFDWKNIGEAYTVPFFNSITSSICYLEVQNKEIIRQEPNPKDLCGLDEDEACQLFEQLFEMIIFMSGFDAKNSDGDPYDFSKYIREKNRRIIIAVAKPIYGSINKRTNNLQIGEFVIGLGIVDNDQSVDENGNKRFQMEALYSSLPEVSNNIKYHGLYERYNEQIQGYLTRPNYTNNQLQTVSFSLANNTSIAHANLFRKLIKRNVQIINNSESGELKRLLEIKLLFPMSEFYLPELISLNQKLSVLALTPTRKDLEDHYTIRKFAQEIVLGKYDNIFDLLKKIEEMKVKLKNSDDQIKQDSKGIIIHLFQLFFIYLYSNLSLSKKIRNLDKKEFIDDFLSNLFLFKESDKENKIKQFEKNKDLMEQAILESFRNQNFIRKVFSDKFNLSNYKELTPLSNNKELKFESSIDRELRLAKEYFEQFFIAVYDSYDVMPSLDNGFILNLFYKQMKLNPRTFTSEALIKLIKKDDSYYPFFESLRDDDRAYLIQTLIDCFNDYLTIVTGDTNGEKIMQMFGDDVCFVSKLKLFDTRIVSKMSLLSHAYKYSNEPYLYSRLKNGIKYIRGSNCLSNESHFDLFANLLQVSFECHDLYYKSPEKNYLPEFYVEDMFMKSKAEYEFTVKFNEIQSLFVEIGDYFFKNFLYSYSFDVLRHEIYERKISQMIEKIDELTNKKYSSSNFNSFFRPIHSTFTYITRFVRKAGHSSSSFFGRNTGLSSIGSYFHNKYNKIKYKDIKDQKFSFKLKEKVGLSAKRQRFYMYENLQPDNEATYTIARISYSEDVVPFSTFAKRNSKHIHSLWTPKKERSQSDLSEYNLGNKACYMKVIENKTSRRKINFFGDSFGNNSIRYIPPSFLFTVNQLSDFDEYQFKLSNIFEIFDETASTESKLFNLNLHKGDRIKGKVFDCNSQLILDRDIPFEFFDYVLEKDFTNDEDTQYYLLLQMKCFFRNVIDQTENKQKIKQTRTSIDNEIKKYQKSQIEKLTNIDEDFYYIRPFTTLFILLKQQKEQVDSHKLISHINSIKVWQKGKTFFNDLNYDFNFLNSVQDSNFSQDPFSCWIDNLNSNNPHLYRLVEEELQIYDTDLHSTNAFNNQHCFDYFYNKNFENFDGNSIKKGDFLNKNSEKMILDVPESFFDGLIGKYSDYKSTPSTYLYLIIQAHYFLSSKINVDRSVPKAHPVFDSAADNNFNDFLSIRLKIMCQLMKLRYKDCFDSHDLIFESEEGFQNFKDLNRYQKKLKECFDDSENSILTAKLIDLNNPKELINLNIPLKFFDYVIKSEASDFTNEFSRHYLILQSLNFLENININYSNNSNDSKIDTLLNKRVELIQNLTIQLKIEHESFRKRFQESWHSDIKDQAVEEQFMMLIKNSYISAKNKQNDLQKKYSNSDNFIIYSEKADSFQSIFFNQEAKVSKLYVDYLLENSNNSNVEQPMTLYYLLSIVKIFFDLNDSENLGEIDQSPENEYLAKINQSLNKLKPKLKDTYVAFNEKRVSFPEIIDELECAIIEIEKLRKCHKVIEERVQVETQYYIETKIIDKIISKVDIFQSILSNQKAEVSKSDVDDLLKNSNYSNVEQPMNLYYSLSIVKIFCDIKDSEYLGKIDQSLEKLKLKLKDTYVEFNEKRVSFSEIIDELECAKIEIGKLKKCHEVIEERVQVETQYHVETKIIDKINWFRECKYPIHDNNIFKQLFELDGITPEKKEKKIFSIEADRQFEKISLTYSYLDTGEWLNSFYSSNFEKTYGEIFEIMRKKFKELNRLFRVFKNNIGNGLEESNCKNNIFQFLIEMSKIYSIDYDLDSGSTGISEYDHSLSYDTSFESSSSPLSLTRQNSGLKIRVSSCDDLSKVTLKKTNSLPTGFRYSSPPSSPRFNSNKSYTRAVSPAGPYSSSSSLTKGFISPQSSSRPSSPSKRTHSRSPLLNGIDSDSSFFKNPIPRKNKDQCLSPFPNIQTENPTSLNFKRLTPSTLRNDSLIGLPLDDSPPDR